MTATTRFDAGYYRRFYGARKTRVADLDATRRLAGFVVGYLRYLRVPLRSVLDVGCGLGHWRTALQELAPRARHHGVEVSDYLCKRFGWTRGSVVDHRPGRTFDLVVCQGVLQYLDDEACSLAIGNLAAACGAVLFLEVPTVGDLDEVIDQDATDMDIHWRTGSWYRRRLGRHFQPIGGGLFVARTAGLNFYELERCG